MFHWYYGHSDDHVQIFIHVGVSWLMKHYYSIHDNAVYCIHTVKPCTSIFNIGYGRFITTLKVYVVCVVVCVQYWCMRVCVCVKSERERIRLVCVTSDTEAAKCPWPHRDDHDFVLTLWRSKTIYTRKSESIVFSALIVGSDHEQCSNEHCQ